MYGKGKCRPTRRGIAILSSRRLGGQGTLGWAGGGGEQKQENARGPGGPHMGPGVSLAGAVVAARQGPRRRCHRRLGVRVCRAVSAHSARGWKEGVRNTSGFTVVSPHLGHWAMVGCNQHVTVVTTTRVFVFWWDGPGGSKWAGGGLVDERSKSLRLGGATHYFITLYI